MNWLIVLLMVLFVVVLLVSYFVEDDDVRALAIIFLSFTITVVSFAISDRMADSVEVKTYSVETVVEQRIIEGDAVSSDTTYVIRFER